MGGTVVMTVDIPIDWSKSKKPPNMRLVFTGPTVTLADPTADPPTDTPVVTVRSGCRIQPGIYPAVSTTKIRNGKEIAALDLGCGDDTPPKNEWLYGGACLCPEPMPVKLYAHWRVVD